MRQIEQCDGFLSGRGSGRDETAKGWFFSKCVSLSHTLVQSAKPTRYRVARQFCRLLSAMSKTRVGRTRRPGGPELLDGVPGLVLLPP